MKRKIKAMNAYIGDVSLVKNKDFIFEPKLDGIRAICYVNDDVQFLSRNDLDLTYRFPELNVRKDIKAEQCILDGEIVAFDENGNPDFNLLQQGYEGSYAVFDILMKDGKVLTNLPLMERKKILSKTVRDGAHIAKVPYTKDGEKLWDTIKSKGVEGIIAKSIDSIYYPGQRTKVWLKIKSLNTIDCVIVGYTTGKRTISSLMLGLYDAEGNLNYIGMTGTGFSFEMLDNLHEILKKIETNKPPVINPIKIKNAHWVKPKIVCEVEYLKMTRNKYLRISSFLRIRTDKKPKDCTFQEQL